MDHYVFASGSFGENDILIACNSETGELRRAQVSHSGLHSDGASLVVMPNSATVVGRTVEWLTTVPRAEGEVDDTLLVGMEDGVVSAMRWETSDNPDWKLISWVQVQPGLVMAKVDTSGQVFAALGKQTEKIFIGKLQNSVPKRLWHFSLDERAARHFCFVPGSFVPTVAVVHGLPDCYDANHRASRVSVVSLDPTAESHSVIWTSPPALLNPICIAPVFNTRLGGVVITTKSATHHVTRGQCVATRYFGDQDQRELAENVAGGAVFGLGERFGEGTNSEADIVQCAVLEDENALEVFAVDVSGKALILAFNHLCPVAFDQFPSTAPSELILLGSQGLLAIWPGMSRLRNPAPEPVLEQPRMFGLRLKDGQTRWVHAKQDTLLQESDDEASLPVRSSPSKQRKRPRTQAIGRAIEEHGVSDEPKVSQPLKECEVCGSKFSKNSHLYRHIRSVHEQARPFSCDLCDFKFGQRAHLVQHKRKIHPAQGRSPDVPRKCHICKPPTVHSSQTELRRHKLEVHPEIVARRRQLRDRQGLTYDTSHADPSGPLAMLSEASLRESSNPAANLAQPEQTSGLEEMASNHPREAE